MNTSQNLSAEIFSIIKPQMDDILEELTVQLMRIADEALAIARRDHQYLVQTNNLASSTGFAVIRDGEVVKISAFDKAEGHDGGEEGTRKGKEYLKLLLDEDSSTGAITLIMVAGMDYAAVVENKYNLDVLKSAERHIRNEFEKLAQMYS